MSIDKICKVWYNGEFGLLRAQKARHYNTLKAVCQVKKYKKIQRFFGKIAEILLNSWVFGFELGQF